VRCSLPAATGISNTKPHYQAVQVAIPSHSLTFLSLCISVSHTNGRVKSKSLGCISGEDLLSARPLLMSLLLQIHGLVTPTTLLSSLLFLPLHFLPSLVTSVGSFAFRGIGVLCRFSLPLRHSIRCCLRSVRSLESLWRLHRHCYNVCDTRG
jgi:hypothetical protein